MADLFEYECPCCAGKIKFDSATQQMKCPYCDTTFDMETLRSYDEAMKGAEQTETELHLNPGGEWADGETDNMLVYVCNSCGGEIVADKTTGATHCPYCDSPVVVAGTFAGDLKPDYVIPFRLDKEAAMASLKKHLDDKFLLPDAFKSDNHIEEIKSVYVPFWMFDANAHGNVMYKATKVRHWEDANYRYTETKFYTVTREGDIGFENVPVDGSSKMPDDLMESVEPYDFRQAQPFNAGYLSGYLADKYDVDADRSVDRANTRVKQSVRDELRRTVVGFDTVTQQKENISLVNGSARYVLCPVWILNTTWNGQKYMFAMNGQTGKFVGNLPIDMGKFWKWTFIYGAIFGAIGGVLGAVLGALM